MTMKTIKTRTPKTVSRARWAAAQAERHAQKLRYRKEALELQLAMCKIDIGELDAALEGAARADRDANLARWMASSVEAPWRERKAKCN